MIDTVHHEIAHHFGISDARLHELAPGAATAPRPLPYSRVDARILLVEDDPSIREITALGLRAAGFEVDDRRRRRRGPGALAARSTRPRPARRDAAAARRPRGAAARSGARRRRPIVMLTARADTIDVVVGPRVGRRRLRAQAVRDAGARRAGPGGAPPAPAARTRATPRTGSSGSGRCASTPPAGPSTRDGAAIALTRTEFDLLVELARHPGQVVHPRPAARPGLGLRLPRRLAPRRRRDRAAAGEGRGRSRRAAR